MRSSRKLRPRKAYILCQSCFGRAAEEQRAFPNLLLCDQCATQKVYAERAAEEDRIQHEAAMTELEYLRYKAAFEVFKKKASP